MPIPPTVMARAFHRPGVSSAPIPCDLSRIPKRSSVIGGLGRLTFSDFSELQEVVGRCSYSALTRSMSPVFTPVCRFQPTSPSRGVAILLACTALITSKLRGRKALAQDSRLGYSNMIHHHNMSSAGGCCSYREGKSNALGPPRGWRSGTIPKRESMFLAGSRCAHPYQSLHLGLAGYCTGYCSCGPGKRG